MGNSVLPTRKGILDWKEKPTTLIHDIGSQLYHNALAPSIFVALWLTSWELGNGYLGLNRLIYPTPMDIWTAAPAGLSLLATNLHITLIEVAAGFSIGASLGLFTGSLIGVSRAFERVLFPMAIILKSIPIIAITPLLLIWFGYGLGPKIAAAAIITYFPMVVATAQGIKLTDPILIDLMKSLSATGRQVFFKVRFPLALPFIFAGLKISITLGVIGAVVAEMVAGSGGGAGYLINRMMELGKTSQSFVLFTFLSLVSMLLFFIVGFMEKRMTPWATSSE